MNEREKGGRTERKKEMIEQNRLAVTFQCEILSAEKSSQCEPQHWSKD